MEQQVLDEFEDYWALLPTKDPEIYFEIQNYLKSPGGETNASRIFKKSTITYFETNFAHFPYPVCQILSCFPSPISGQIIHNTLLNFCKTPDTLSEKKWKLFNFLANIHLVDKWMENFEQNVLPTIYQTVNENYFNVNNVSDDTVAGAVTDIINDNEFAEIVLALLSNRSMKLLRAYVDYEKYFVTQSNVFTPKAVYTMAIDKKIHFFEHLFVDEFGEKIPFRSRHCLNLVKTIITISNGVNKTKENFEEIYENFNHRILPAKLESNQMVIYDEIKRIFQLYSFLRSNIRSNFESKGIPIRIFSGKYSIIDYLHEHLEGGTVVVKEDYETIRSLLVENKAINSRVNSAISDEDEKPPELDVFDQYFALDLFIDVLLNGQADTKDKTAITTKCQEIKIIIVGIRSVKGYIEILEAIHTLLFLRWEHVHGRSGSSSKVDVSSSITTLDESDTSEYDDDNVFLSGKRATQLNTAIDKVGFVCSYELLNNMLNSLNETFREREKLKKFQTIANNNLKERFDRIFNEIENARWRLNLFEPIYPTGEKIKFLNDLKQLVTPFYSEIFTSTLSSSEDETDDRNRHKTISIPTPIATRRKPRRKHPFKKYDHDKSMSFMNSTEIERKLVEPGSSSSRTSSVNDRRSIISRMLGPSLNLVAICMSKGNMKEAKSIIQENGIENNSLARELKFYENFNATKNELKDILPKPMADRTSKSIIDSDISVELIKTIAAHGFESSQVSNLMQAFMEKNKIEQSADTRQLLERYSPNYPFLKLYVSGSLQGTTVVDYILSLSTNYDICYNLFNILPKLWDQPESIDSLEDQIGFYGCMEKMISSLNLYNAATNQNYGVQYLMSNVCSSFRPNEMGLKLKQKKTYERLKNFDSNALSTIETLKEYISQFDIFNKRDGNLLSHVFCYAINMNRLINFKDIKMKVIVQTSPKAILEIDLFSLIGEIIFGNHSNSITPYDIEAIVCNLNTNLLHVLSMNTCPIIGVCRKFGEEPNGILDRVLATIEENNGDVTNLDESQPIPKVKKTYKIQSKDLLNYIRKHNDLIAYLMGEIHDIKFMGNDNEKPFDFDYTFLKNVLNMKETKIRYELYDNNPMIAALNFDYFDVFGVKRLLKQRKFFAVLQIIQYCKESDWMKYHANLSKLQDFLIKHLLNETDRKSSVSYSYKIIENIKDIQTKTRILLRIIHKIDDDRLAKRLIKTILLHNRIVEVNEHQKSQLEKYLADIEVYANIANILSRHSTQMINWILIMNSSKDNPEWILNSLIKYREFGLCYEWIKIHPLNSSISSDILESIFRSVSKKQSKLNEDLFRIIEAVPKQLIVEFDSFILLRLRNHQLLEYLIDYLTEDSVEENENYRNYKISLKILEVVPEDEASTLWDIVNNPLLIIEQYVMNSKFESFTCILKAIKPMIANVKKCKICAEKRNELFSGKSNSDPNFNSKLYVHANCNSNSDLLLSRFDYNYNNHYIGIECIGSLLRVYAAKALDFRISETHSDMVSQTTEMVSLDSLCGTFVMPLEVPEKSQWIRDEEASHCMCCRRGVFTMLTRRHHCRRCGRVVCHSCSTKRMNIPNMYADVFVRVCDDCYRQTEQMDSTRSLQITEGTPSNSLPAFPIIVPRTVDDCGWLFRFSGHFKHDKLLREEFCYEYAPSVSLCLSILSFHTSGLECATFLLHHCRKFESLLRPIHPGHANPEVDYAFVTRILYCLSLAVKVHGGSPECAKIREHAEIINSVVRNGCEALLPMEELNTSSLRKLRDSLVVAEKWSLAVELSLKCGFPKTGIMAAWGIACLKSGCFETAREKFSYCLTKTTVDEDKKQVIDLLSTDDHALKSSKRKFSFRCFTRSPKVQPLLHEIISVLETTCHPVNSDVLHKVSIIRHSNRSLTSIKLRKKENLPVHEPAINVLHTLANLKQVAQGKFCVKHDGFMNFILPTSSVSATTVPITPPATINVNVSQSPADVEKIHPGSRFYSECISYLAIYGRHNDILEFLVKHKQITKALYYTMLLKIPSEQFIQTMILPFLKTGKLSIIIGCMIEMDETLVTWKEYIIQTCRLLEKKQLYNSLYQLQLMLQDTVRASMTCVRFYTMKCSSYLELQSNSFHLINAQKHLNSELELCQWEEIKVQSKNKQEDNLSLAMKMDPKALNQHINTIWRQIEAAKFLAKCEESGRETVKIIPKISMFQCTRIPTLFGTAQDKIIITALILICGSNIEEGFGLAYRIIQEMSLNADKIYAIVTKYVALSNRVHDVEKLIECIRSNSAQSEKRLCDEILSLAVQSALNTHNAQQIKSTIENLIRMIDDIGTQIDCHLLSGQLKAAYLLAVHHRRITDIRRILRHAEKTNQPQIRKLCEKKLLALEDGSDTRKHS